jgi:hypothetical protein
MFLRSAVAPDPSLNFASHDSTDCQVFGVDLASGATALGSVKAALAQLKLTNYRRTERVGTKQKRLALFPEGRGAGQSFG